MSHGGPYHRSSDSSSVEAVAPLEAMSAGFSSVGTCLHRGLLYNSCCVCQKDHQVRAG